MHNQFFEQNSRDWRRKMGTSSATIAVGTGLPQPPRASSKMNAGAMIKIRNAFGSQFFPPWRFLFEIFPCGMLLRWLKRSVSSALALIDGHGQLVINLNFTH